MMNMRRGLGKGWQGLVGLVLFMVFIGGCGINETASGVLATESGELQGQEEQLSSTPTPSSEKGQDEGQSRGSLRVKGGGELFDLGDLSSVPSTSSALPVEHNSYFATSGECTICHQDMKDEGGDDVSTDSLWRAAIMANASRDPYWQASVKSQVMNVPELEGLIEDKCATCHMPMARFGAHQEGDKGIIFGAGFNNPDHPSHAFAVDGVSCTVCHQIEGGNFGQESSFSGGFTIDKERPLGSRWAYGPYQTTDRYEVIMAGPSGFLPGPSSHVDRSEMCATCHTLYTPYIDEKGEIGGYFPEQVPYLEWKQSSFVQEKSCQDCHMPLAEGGVVLSVTGGSPRSPFYKHLFIGGNTYILRQLRKFGEEMDVTASSEDFERKIKDTLTQLQNDVARLSIQKASIEGSQIVAELTIENLTGHKFPTAFPSRRAWVHLVVENEEGEIIFESGEYNEAGKLEEGNHDLEPGSYEKHYGVVSRENQVQIYESVLENVKGEVTTVLLHASGYIKDNRLLPKGFVKADATQDTQVQGEAAADDNFQGGRDTVIYRVDITDEEGPFRVTAELLYQSIGFRWGTYLAKDESPEAETFLRYYYETENLPVWVAGDEVVIEE